MFKLLFVMLSLAATASSVAATSSADLPTRKYLNLAAIKTMVAAAEAEAKKQNVEVTICIVDESGNLLFLEKADAAIAQHHSVCAAKSAPRRLLPGSVEGAAPTP